MATLDTHGLTFDAKRKHGARAGGCALVLWAACAWTASGDALSLSASAGPGGAILPLGEIAIEAGSDATFEIAPAAGFHIADVLVNGRSVGPVPVFTFVEARSNQTIEASFHVPWASRVVSYAPGTNAAVQWHYPQTALGEPSRRTNYGFADVTMFQPPWMTNQIVSIGSGGELTVEFAGAVTNDPHNIHGIDLLVFGNAMFEMVGGRASGLSEEPALISVSQDGAAWHEVPLAQADSLFPTLGFTNATAPANEWFATGTSPTSFVRPVDPSAACANKTYAELVALYDGAGGGAGVDLAHVGLAWIRYVRVWQPAGQSWSAEVDAFADAAPSLSRTVNIASARGHSLPAPGAHAATSGVPVTCSVTQSVVALGDGVRAACRGWTATEAGGAVSSGTQTTRRFAPVEHTSLTWLWETEYWIDVAAEAGGLVSADSGWLVAGSTLEVMATPAAGFTFAEWSGDVGGADVRNPSLTLDADRTRTVRARFEECAVSPLLADWLIAFGLTNASPAAEADLDHDEDGFTAREEFAAGTDPNDERSCLRLADMRNASGVNELVWLGGPGGAPVGFTVWTSGAPHVGWTVLTSGLAKASNGTNRLSHAAAGNGPLFYRITVPTEEP